MNKGKISAADFKKILKEQGLDIADDLLTITDPDLDWKDAQAVIDLVIGTNFNNKSDKIKMITKKRGLNTNPYQFDDLAKIAGSFGYTIKSVQRVKILVNPKGNPKYLIRSNTSHSGDVYKGFNNERDAINAAQKGSSKPNERVGSYNIHLERVGD